MDLRTYIFQYLHISNPYITYFFLEISFKVKIDILQLV